MTILLLGLGLVIVGQIYRNEKARQKAITDQEDNAVKVFEAKVPK